MDTTLPYTTEMSPNLPAKVQEKAKNFNTMMTFVVVMIILIFLLVMVAMGFGIQAWVRTQKFVTWSSSIQTVRENQNRILLRDDIDVELPVNLSTEVVRIGMNNTSDYFAMLRLRVYLEALDLGSVSASGSMSFVGVNANWTMIGAVTTAALTFNASSIAQGEQPLIMTNTGPSRVRVIRVEILQ